MQWAKKAKTYADLSNGLFFIREMKVSETKERKENSSSCMHILSLCAFVNTHGKEVAAKMPEGACLFLHRAKLIPIAMLFLFALRRMHN